VDARLRHASNPPREGLDICASFNGETSGLFGLDLAPDRWITIDDCRRASDYGANYTIWTKI